MKKINLVKIFLDILMMLVFVLLYNKGVLSGLQFHEIAGLCLGGVFIIHIGLNWRWVKQVTLNILKKKMAIKTRIGYVVDLLLLGAIGYIIISGIIISKVLFPNINVGNEMFFESTHISVAYAALLLVGIHLGLHWDWVMDMFKKMFKITQTKKSMSYVAKLLMIIVLVFGIHSMNSTNYLKKLPIVSASSNVGHGTDNNKGYNNSMVHSDGNGKMTTFSEHGSGFSGGERGGGNANVVNILSTYLGIIGAFAIATFYIEKLLLMLRKRNKILYAQS